VIIVVSSTVGANVGTIEGASVLPNVGCKVGDSVISAVRIRDCNTAFSANP